MWPPKTPASHEVIHMANINRPDLVAEQYKKADNLQTRMNFHQKYGRNQRGPDCWFPLYHFWEHCTVLEIGCGTGAMWQEKFEKLPVGVSVTLTDHSQGMVDTVYATYGHLPGVHTAQADVQCLTYADESFDIVIANSMLYHVPDIEHAVGEIHRVLKPGGTLYAATFGSRGTFQFLREKLSVFNPRLSAFKDAEATFHMQNGWELLKRYFADVIQHEFFDTLEVTDTADIVAYIRSSTQLAGLQEQDYVGMQTFWDAQKDARGVVSIPRHYGTFIAQKRA